MAGGNLCDAAEEYIRCIFQAMNLSSSSMSELALTNLENTLEQTLAAYGINCNIDIRAILKKSTGKHLIVVVSIKVICRDMLFLHCFDLKSLFTFRECIGALLAQ